MNTEQEQHLEKIFRDNQNQGIAIAITGCWGVGKTFFWQNFLKNQTMKEYDHFNSFYYHASKVNYVHIFENKKYAYISLFGVESLDALKNEISIKLGWNPYSRNVHKHYGIPQLLKKTLAQFKDIKFSHYGVSSSSKLVDSLLFGQVKNAIICFDDFERLSEKLKIQDVMGLANQLKIERNCQVILILDESKTIEKNQKKYTEYKEKLIDETIKINSVEPLIRVNTQDIDKPLVDLMVKFAEALEIHNFRFFQKVIKLYMQFREQLLSEVAYSTKEIILIRVLQGYFIEDFGEKLGIYWNSFTFNNAIIRRQNKDNSENSNNAEVIFTKLEEISYKLTIAEDEWSFEFKKWFEQRDKVNFEVLKRLAQSDLNTEKNNLLKDELHYLMNKWRNLEVDEKYCEELFTVASKLVGIESLGLLELSAILLKKFGQPELSRRLKKTIIDNLKIDLETNAIEIYQKYQRSPVQHLTIFHRYIKMFRINNPTTGLPSLVDVLKADLIEGVQLHFAKEVINNTKESEWEVFIFEDASTDPELSKLTKADVIDRLLSNLNIIGVDQAILKTKIRNVLESRMDRLEPSAIKENYKLVIENFKKEGLL